MSDFTAIRDTLERANSLAIEDAIAPNTKLKLSPPRAVEQSFAPTLGTQFEQTARQQCEVNLIMNRQLENALAEQVKLATEELLGVRKVIASHEALLAVLNAE